MTAFGPNLQIGPLAHWRSIPRGTPTHRAGPATMVPELTRQAKELPTLDFYKPMLPHAPTAVGGLPQRTPNLQESGMAHKHDEGRRSRG